MDGASFSSCALGSKEGDSHLHRICRSVVSWMQEKNTCF